MTDADSKPFPFKPPKTEACRNCEGSGSFPGLLRPLVCMPCDGFGWVNAKTGEALTKDERIAMLRRDLQAAHGVIERQTKQLEALAELRDKLANQEMIDRMYPPVTFDSGPVRRGGHGD